MPLQLYGSFVSSSAVVIKCLYYTDRTINNFPIFFKQFIVFISLRIFWRKARNMIRKMESVVLKFIPYFVFEDIITKSYCNENLHRVKLMSYSNFILQNVIIQFFFYLRCNFFNLVNKSVVPARLFRMDMLILFYFSLMGNSPRTERIRFNYCCVLF